MLTKLLLALGFLLDGSLFTWETWKGKFFCPVLLERQPEMQPFMSLLHVRGRVPLAVPGRAAVKVTFNLSDGVFFHCFPPPPPWFTVE